MSDTVLVALIIAATTIISALIALASAVIVRKLDTLGIQVDGRLTQLLESTQAAAHAQGVMLGTEIERDREVSDGTYTAT